jgi:hypothetical protein
MTEEGNLGNADADGSAEELWQVRVAPDDVREMTFEQLEAAFFAGLIDADTSVLDAGATEWKTLRQIAGRDTVESPPPASSDADADTSVPDAGAIAPPAPAQLADRDTVDGAGDSPPPASDAADTDFELKLVDFRAGQRRAWVLAAGGAIVLAIVIALVASFERPLPSLPTPWLDATAGVAEKNAGAHQPDDSAQTKLVSDAPAPSVKSDRSAPARPIPVGGPPATRRHPRDKLFHP